MRFNASGNVAGQAQGVYSFDYVNVIDTAQLQSGGNFTANTGITIKSHYLQVDSGATIHADGLVITLHYFFMNFFSV